ncbi:hypothetical protein GCM10009830_16970 [Glycomyces endophyticus]|uniref:Uncharacterized protein n=1 Tax=Glycomyces endophyticus TaxID=480996 RepID=A0ABP4SG38_9ACTN
MAIEYHFEVSPVLDAPAMLDYLAELLGCEERFEEPGAPARAGRKEVVLTAAEWGRDEESDMADLFGTDRITSLTFRMNKFLTSEESHTIFHDMIAACVQFFEDHPGAKGLFSFQYEDIYLQRLADDGIVLSERLREPDFNTGDRFSDVLSRYSSRALGMVEDHLSR